MFRLSHTSEQPASNCHGLYIADAYASGRPIQLQYTMQCPLRPISVDENMTQMRSTSNPAYDGLLMDTCVKRQRDSGRSPHPPYTSILVSKFTLGSSIKGVRMEGEGGYGPMRTKANRGRRS